MYQQQKRNHFQFKIFQRVFKQNQDQNQGGENYHSFQIQLKLIQIFFKLQKPNLRKILINWIQLQKKQKKIFIFRNKILQFQKLIMKDLVIIKRKTQHLILNQILDILIIQRSQNRNFKKDQLILVIQLFLIKLFLQKQESQNLNYNQNKVTSFCQNSRYDINENNLQQKIINKGNKENQLSIEQRKLVEEIKNVDQKNLVLKIQDSLRKSILSEIKNKQKDTYENLMKNLQQKLSNKFSFMIQQVLKEKCQDKNKNQQCNEKDNIEKKKKGILKNQLIMEDIILNRCEIGVKENMNQNQRNIELISKRDDEKQNIRPNIINQQKYNLAQVKNENYKANTTVSSNIQKRELGKFEKKLIQQSNVIDSNKQIFEDIKQGVQSISINQTKLTSSSIVQKDASKIIKSKNKNNLNLNTLIKFTKDQKNQRKSSSIQTNQFKKTPLLKQQQKDSDKVHKQRNKVISNQSSIDSIQIIDESQNFKNFNKTSLIISQKINQSSTKQVSLQNKESKKEDNFFLKRIKQLKFNMQVSLKNYQDVCSKLTLPVNQTFMLLFSSIYNQFCQAHTLNANNIEVRQNLSKYKTEQELSAKLPSDYEKFIMDSLGKIEKMINLKCAPQKKIKIEQYALKCIDCTQKIYFQKPDLDLKCQKQLLEKIRKIKLALST